MLKSIVQNSATPERNSAVEKQIPFQANSPNAKTIQAMKELKQGKGKKFTSKEALFKDLGI